MDFLWTYIIIIVNILFSYKGFNDPYFFRKYQFHIGSVRAGEQVRILSSGFLHVDMVHLAFNMITLYFFGPIVATTLGSFNFLAIYLVSLIAGNLLTLYFHANNYSYSAVGASGAVMGILYAVVLMFPNMEIGVFGIIPMPAYVFGIIYLLYSIYGMKAQNDNIGHTAHIGGAICGYLYTLFLRKELLVENLQIVILLALPIILLIVLVKMGKL